LLQDSSLGFHCPLQPYCWLLDLLIAQLTYLRLSNLSCERMMMMMMILVVY
jgi:hypothetical protein